MVNKFMSNLYRIIKTGLTDGFGQPWDLTSGMTYDQPWRNELYDISATVGQWIGRVFNRSGC